ncbi:MAG: alpha/beta hydrolase [Candidatus Bilamarchaeaceae archaeon]
MSTVFIIHGWGANPESNWFPWLKKELEKRGYKVFVPAFPDSDFPNLAKWLKEFEKYRKYIDKNTIFVGHSLGVPFILNILERLDHSVKAAFLVAGFVGSIGDEFDGYIRDISMRTFNWKKIRQNCKRFVVFASDNDPYVPMKKTKELRDLLASELIIIKGAAHLNAGSGYFTFDELRDAILQACSVSTPSR